MQPKQIQHDLVIFSSYQGQIQKIEEELGLRTKSSATDQNLRLPPEVAARLVDVLQCLRSASAELGYCRKRLGRELPPTEQETYHA